MSYFFIQAGPRFSILVNQSVVNPPKDRPYLPEQNGKANNFDLSATIAGGISFGNRSNEILLRYDYSFSDSFPSLNEFNTTGDPNAPLRKVQHIVSIAYSKTLF